MSKILVKAEPPLSNKILIRKEIAVQQIVGGGTKPTFGDMYGAFRGRGTKPGTKVGIGGRLRGLAGMAGKTAAAAVTAQQTAEAMQGGNLGAPLQAGVTYQGMDPTATMNPNIAQQIEGTKAPETTALPPAKFPKNMRPTGPRTGAVGIAPTNNTSTSSVYQTPTYGNFTTNSDPELTRGPHDKTGLGPVASPLTPAHTQPHSVTQALLNTLNEPTIPYGSPQQPVAPVPVAPLPAPAAPASTQAAPASVLPTDPAQTQLPFTHQSPQETSLTGGITNYMQAQVPPQPQQPVSTATPPNMGLPQAQQGQQGQPQNLQHYNKENPPGSYNQPHIGDDLPPTWGKSFADTVFDKLGPDMVYKMTPHQIATLSAYMYLKLS